MTPLRLAFIGAGGIAGAHSKGILDHPEAFELVAVCDIHRPAAEEVAARFQSEAAIFDTYQNMFDQMGDKIDGAIVILPHWLHFPAAAACLERGVPALVEKPVACSVSEFRQLAALEKKHGCFVQAGQMQRFGAEENWIRQWLKSDSFGEPNLFNLDIYQNSENHALPAGKSWILDGKRAGGGIISSVAIHILDLLRYWLDDDYAEVFSFGRFDPPFINKAESTVAATFRTKRGIMGTLNSTYSARRCPYSQRAVLFGSHGTLYQHLSEPGSAYAGEYYIASNEGVSDQVWETQYTGFKPIAAFMSEPVSPDGVVASFTAQLFAFAEAIRNGRATENSLERNFNTIAVVEAIARTLESGKPEMVESL